MIHFNSLNRTYGPSDKSVPASVRLYNIGAIGSSRDKHENRFGAVESTDLPGSDGKPLSTPCFSTIYGGAAYFGHYITRRVYFENRDDNSWTITLREIFKKYATGSSDKYMNTVAKDTKLGVDEAIDILGAKDDKGPAKLYWVMLAMGRWEAAARTKAAKGYASFEKVYLDTPELQDELWYGMRHGVWEAVRDAGYDIKRQDTEYNFGADGRPITRQILPQKPSIAPENARTAPSNVSSTANNGKTKLETVIEKDAAISGPLAGSRTLLSGAIALVTNFVNGSLTEMGVLSETQQIWLTGFFVATISAFAFFLFMKLLRLYVTHQADKNSG